MTESPRRILVFGGTFDPPHVAHVQVPRHVAATLACDLVLFVPAARNPLKPHGPVASDDDRLAMLRLAVRNLPRSAISTVEIERGAPSYFVDTIEHLRREHGVACDVRFLLGADQVSGFRRWRDWRRLLALATPVVALRPPWTPETYRRMLARELDAAEAAAWLERTVEAPRLDASATVLRRRLAAGLDPGPGLDPAVARYIAERGLYREPGPAADR